MFRVVSLLLSFSFVRSRSQFTRLFVYYRYCFIRYIVIVISLLYVIVISLSFIRSRLLFVGGEAWGEVCGR